MHKTVIVNVVGLTSRLLGENTPFLKKWSEQGRSITIEPTLPAVTCTAQATYLTGSRPTKHGIVGNGWLFRDELEVKLWRQSNKLVQAEKIWDVARKKDPTFTCANMFWWYNMYSSVDYSVTPRPNYLANGRKVPDVYSHPVELRDFLNHELGPFPLFHFWGPGTSIKSSRWIADASILVDEMHEPTLTLIYLPHLDYNLQRHGPDDPRIHRDLSEIDVICQDLITHYQEMGARIIVLSEYGITRVQRPIHLNRILREHGLLALRREQHWELLDTGASQAFALADHQIAHVYVKDQSKIPQVRSLLENIEGVDMVLGENEKREFQIDHIRSGELIAIADSDSWFTYYYWLEDQFAPDFARTVDIHRKPGYDPVEMFADPKIRFLTLLVAGKLLKKSLGFSTLMDIIPLDATLIKGSHGRINNQVQDQPILITQQGEFFDSNIISSHEVFDSILLHLGAS